MKLDGDKYDQGLMLGRTEIQLHQDMKQFREPLENFLKKMHTPPAPSTIKVNALAGNSSYLGISQLEMELDKYFLGQWNFIPVEGGSKVLVNSITYDGILEALHPVSGFMLRRAGAGAVPIQVYKDGHKNAGEPQSKAIQKGIGAAKSMAFKNACKSLGKRFGRDLNRIAGDEAEYEKFYTQKPVDEQQAPNNHE